MQEPELIEDEEQELFEIHRIQCDPGQVPLRIDRFLMDRIPNTSRSKIQAAAKAGLILVNDEPVKVSLKVRPGDQISVNLPYEREVIALEPEDIPLEVISEDPAYVIINKPAGLVVHPGHGNHTGTLVNALLFHFGKLLPPGSGPTPRPGLIHRLDKDTTGLMVIAKNEEAHAFLAKQFFDRTIDRNYNALVWGDLKEDSGTITGNIGRNLKNRKIMDVFPDEDRGKHAVTHFTVLERFGYVTLVECKLETGRTHQIRAHFKYIGHPLFGDVDYGGDKILKGTTFTKYKQFVHNCFGILNRQALHARSLGFEHPVTHKRVFHENNLPADMAEVIERWRNYIATR